MNKTTEALKAEKWLEWFVEGEHCDVAPCTAKEALSAIREALADQFPEATKMVAECKPAPDGRIPKTVFTLEDIGKAFEQGRSSMQCEMEALAEPMRQEPVNLKPCNSPYCECAAGKCSRTGFYDDRHDPVCTCPSGDGSLRWPCPVHPKPADPVKQKPVAFTDQHTQYVMQYGGTCRDCADENGSCPNAGGLPCDGRSKAIEYVLRAIEYGVNNGFIYAPVERQWVDLTDDEIDELKRDYCIKADASCWWEAVGAVIAAFKGKNK